LRCSARRAAAAAMLHLTGQRCRRGSGTCRRRSFIFRLAARDLMQLDVVYEDAELLAVNKPAACFVHRSALPLTKKYSCSIRWRNTWAAPVFLAHRLDRATSGVAATGQSREIAAELGRQFHGAQRGKILSRHRAWLAEAKARSTTLCPTRVKRRRGKPAFDALARARTYRVAVCTR